MKVFIRFLSSLILLLTITIPAYAVDDSPVFSDINGHWAAPVIEDLAGRGLVRGFPDGTFHPGDRMTRAQFISLLIRITGLQPDASGNPGDYGLNPGAWYVGDVLTAGANGIIEKNKPFRPEEPILREEMAMMAVKALDKKAGPIYLTMEYIIFKDEDQVDKGYMTFLQDAYKLHIMRGSDGYIRPQDPSTRAEGLMVLTNLEKAIHAHSQN